MFNREKFKKLVHYVCWKCEDFSSLGAIKLNKILLYTERDYFLKTGESMTGETYVKRQFGPAPKHIVSVLEELQNEHKILVKDTIEYGKPKRRFINLTEPDLTNLSADELSVVDKVAPAICLRHTARSISNETHDAIWEIAELGEEMPLYTVFAVQGEVDEDDYDWARRQVAPKGELVA